MLPVLYKNYRTREQYRIMITVPILSTVFEKAIIEEKNYHIIK